jgi:hypothetical protein
MASELKPLHEPWRSFLREVDRQLSQLTELHCLGGFVIAEYYGLTRATGDIDILESRGTHRAILAKLAGKGSRLHERYRIYFDVVTVADVPQDYESRLSTVFQDRFRHLRLLALERHDLVLAKLARNSDRDREDVALLARDVGLDVAVLRSRYKEELRPYLGVPGREDLTLSLWIEIIEEVKRKR